MDWRQHMKKVFCLILSCAFLFAACGSSTVRVGTEQIKAEIRTIVCSSCHGEKVCWHCSGDAYRSGRRCSICDGTGLCSKCSGKGELEILEIDGRDYTRCTSCSASGICPMCTGSGKMDRYGSSSSNCMICRGTGKCVGCGGSGLVSIHGF